MAAEPEVTPPRSSPLRRAPTVVAMLSVLALVVLLAYGITSRAPHTGIDDQLSKSQAAHAPGFDRLAVLQSGTLPPPLATRLGPPLERGRVSLTQLRGQPVVLNFWASWCPPCRTEAPLLERSWEQARSHGVLFVGLDQQDVTGDAHDFLRQYHTSYPNLRDPPGDVAPRWGVTGLPETFFLTAQGQVVDHVIGVISQQQIDEGMAAARSGHAAGARSGGASQPTR